MEIANQNTASTSGSRVEAYIEYAEQKQKPQFSDAISERIIDLSKSYPEIEFLLKHNGVGCFSLGDIQAMKAKAKQGKTLSLLCVMVTLLRGSYMGFQAVKSDLRVLYIDR